MLRRYLARRKMRWAVRRVAKMTPLQRELWQLRPVWRSIDGVWRELISPANLPGGAKWQEINLDRLNPTK